MSLNSLIAEEPDCLRTIVKSSKESKLKEFSNFLCLKKYVDLKPQF